VARGIQAALRYVAENGSTGYSIAAARLVAAVRDAGVEVEMTGIAEPHRGSASKWVAHSRDDPARAAKAAPSAPTIMHLAPEHLIHVKPATDGPLIVHTVWETDRIPARWPPVLQYSDGVIVPTEWNRETFAACGVGVAIEVVPHVVCSPNSSVRTDQLGIPDGLVVFYAISRWDERKLPSAAVRAFCEAFTAEDRRSSSQRHGASRAYCASTPIRHAFSCGSTSGPTARSRRFTHAATATSRYAMARGGGLAALTPAPTATP
jgi:hypothetical protein